jgi:membrane protease YdiL (CAAX protease family)
MSDADHVAVDPFASPMPATTATVPPKPWGPWATLGWGLLAAVVVVGVQSVVAAVFIVIALLGNPQQDMAATSDSLQYNGLLLSLATLIGSPAGLMVCVLAIWIRRYPILEYLGVQRCSRQDLALGLACMVLFIPASDGLTWLSGRPIVPEFMITAWHTAGFLPLLFLTVVVAAPVGEELFFRGFLFRGWAQSRLGAAGATVLTALLWAVIHVQYDWFFVTHIFVGGLMLGWLRHRSGSTLLPMLMHAVMNFVATLEAAIKVTFLS